MGQTIHDAPQSDPVRKLDRIRPDAAKASLRTSAASDAVGSSDRSGLTIGAVVADAVVDFYGSVKAASFALGENGRQVDPSLMMRDFRRGNLARLERADAEAKGFVSDALRKMFGCSDPKERARAAIRRARRELDELAELTERVI
jgi:hypothetical protein